MPIHNCYTDKKIDKLLKKPNPDNSTEYRNWAIIKYLLATANRVASIIGLNVEDGIRACIIAPDTIVWYTCLEIDIFLIIRRKKMRKVLFAISLCLILNLSGCQQVTFDGSRTSNEEQYMIEYKVLNKADSAQLQLSEGDVVDVEIISNSGKVDVQVMHSDGTEIYRGNDAQTGSFKLSITKAGTYTISVSGRNANGSVRFIKEK